jgi:rhodanese-related sulfurtransferase
MKRYKLINLLYLLIIASLVLVNPGCSEEDDPVAPPSVNEAEVLVKYLEESGDFINSTSCPAMISASDVRTNQLAGSSQFIVDIRAAADFALGHIEGAVNVPLKDIVTYYRTNNLSQYSKVVLVCYTGQTAGYASGMLRVLGYSNVFDLKYGMCSWHSDFAGSWKNTVANGNAFGSQFVTAPVNKNAAGNLPTISTGKTTGPEILEARVSALLGTADPFGDVKLSASSLFANLNGYYIVNYWSLDHYNTGHIPGSIQYTPRADLKLNTYLKTLPIDKPVVIYCYTGQTSAHVAFYLKLLGYDAKTLLFGTNAMNYDNMPGSKFNEASDVMNYPYVN